MLDDFGKIVFSAGGFTVAGNFAVAMWRAWKLSRSDAEREDRRARSDTIDQLRACIVDLRAERDEEQKGRADAEAKFFALRKAACKIRHYSKRWLTIHKDPRDINDLPTFNSIDPAVEWFLFAGDSDDPNPPTE